jgi:hypothetical protein
MAIRRRSRARHTWRLSGQYLTHGIKGAFGPLFCVPSMSDAATDGNLYGTTYYVEAHTVWGECLRKRRESNARKCLMPLLKPSTQR